MRARRRPPAPEPDPVLPPRAAAEGEAQRPSWDADNRVYVFSAGRASYRVLIPDQAGMNPMLRIDGRLDEGDWCVLLAEAGPLFRTDDNRVLRPLEALETIHCADLQHSRRGDALQLEYFEEAQGRKLKRLVSITGRGGALVIRLSSDYEEPAGNYAGFELGPLGSPAGQAVAIPGLPDPLWVLTGGLFAGAYFDRVLSGATECEPGAVRYRPGAAGVQSPIRDVFYLALSDDPLACLPELREPRADYLADLRGRVLLDYYSEGPYVEDARRFAQLAEYGLKDVIVAYRNWEQFGYRRRAPVLYPADPDRGRAEDFRGMVETARRRGWRFALREEYTGISEESPYFDPKCVAVDAAGQPRPSRRPDIHALAGEQLLDFARLETPKIQRNYRPDAVHVGDHAGWDPERVLHQGDAEANKGAGSTMADLMGATAGLLAFLRELHEGPVLADAGAGADRMDVLNAGLVEGAEGYVAGLAEAPLIVDYELAEVNRKQVRYGAGIYRRAVGLKRGEMTPPQDVNWEAYRATAIAMGHNGYLGVYSLVPPQRDVQWPCGSLTRAVYEYHLMRALAQERGDSRLESVHYRHGGSELTLAETLRQDVDLVDAQIHVRYENGLELFVNRDGGRGWTVQAASREFTLPPFGWVAHCPETSFLAYDADVDGHRTDYCACADYRILDVGVGEAREAEGILCDSLAVVRPSPVEGQSDLTLVGVSRFELGEARVESSTRVGLRLTHLSSTEAELALLRSSSDHSVDIRLATFNPAWERGRIVIQELAPHPDRPPRAVRAIEGEVRLGRIRPGERVRLTLQES